MLEKIIKDKIFKNGYVTIEDFINLSLFHSKFGYYINRNPIGKVSDFTTSPEISQIFGEIIAFFLIDFWQKKYSNQKINLVEMGAGHGTLMYDFLRISKKVPSFYQNVNINIIEINQKLKNIQQNKLQDFSVKWWPNFDKFSQNCKNDPIFFISNELFDCFAIDQFVLKDNIWHQKVVILDGKQLKFDKIKTEIDVETLIAEESRENVKNGAIVERSLAAENFMDRLSTEVCKRGGIAINIDYGYYMNFFKDTLQSVKSHKFSNILNDIGKSDITSHVNFYKLAKISINNELNVNFMTQREFLLSNGLDLRRKILLQSVKTKKEVAMMNSDIGRLIDEDQMGNLFKVMIAYGNC